MLMAWTKPGDIVLDPSFGSGTTGAGWRLSRHFPFVGTASRPIDAARQRIEWALPCRGRPDGAFRKRAVSRASPSSA